MARNSRLHTPDRPCGLLEPCAATSGKHGSEEGGAGKRRPLSDNKSHYIRDTVFREDHNQSWKGNGPRALASLRNLATGLFRMKDVNSIKEATEMVHMDRMLALHYMATVRDNRYAVLPANGPGARPPAIPALTFSRRYSR